MPLLRNASGPQAIRNRLHDTLISTKSHIPPLRSRMLPRLHLIDRLLAGKEARLIFISGTAGSGKTSLVCQWIKQDKLPVAWYSLDKADNEPDTFFRYLLTVLSSMDDGLSAAVGLWLQERRRLSGSEIVPMVTQCLLDLSKDIYLVLDDYHLITSGEIHDALAHLLDHMPSKAHLVIISRYALPFSVCRFKIRNQMVELSAKDMKLTEKETEQFFAEIMSVNLTAEETNRVARYMEGWIGGLQLFGLSIKEKVTPEGLGRSLSRSFPETTAYLIDEVVNMQPEKVKTFLYATTHLDRFNVDVCREVTGLRDAPDILDHIYRNNLFLIPLDSEITWFRYHHLFSEAVRERFAISSPDTVSLIHRKAALWFAHNGYLEDALRHAWASGDSGFVADLMEDCWIALYHRYDVAACLNWLAKLPADMKQARPLLRLLECRLRMESFQVLDIEGALKDMEDSHGQIFDRYQGFKRMLCLDLFTYLKYVLPCYRDPTRVDVNQFNEAPRMISPEDKLFSGTAKVNVAACHFLQGNLPLASEALKAASTMINASEGIWGRIFWFRVMGRRGKMAGSPASGGGCVTRGFLVAGSEKPI